MKNRYSKFYEEIEIARSVGKEKKKAKIDKKSDAYSNVSDFFGAIIGCTIIGYIIDSVFSKNFVFTVILFFLGVVSGINLIIKKITKK